MGWDLVNGRVGSKAPLRCNDNSSMYQWVRFRSRTSSTYWPNGRAYCQRNKRHFIQLLFLVGEPVALFGLRIAQDVINERMEWSETDVGLDAADPINDKIGSGQSMLSEHLRRDIGYESDNIATHKLMPNIALLVDSYYFGEVWARDELKTKERMVCSLAALMCRGHLNQLKKQVGLALDMGMNKREICEVFSQAGWYRGWPYVEDALTQAQELFQQRDL